MEPPKVIIAHPGTQHSYKLTNQLVRNGMLYKFVTGVAVIKNGLLHKTLQLLPQKISGAISNRVIENISSKKLTTFPLLEMKAMKATKKSSNKEELLFQRNEAFQKKISNRLLNKADVVIGFDTSSWVLAQRCKSMKKKFILDVSIAHPK